MKIRNVFWIIAGTTEGRKLVQKLSRSDVQIYVSLATEYGIELMPEEAENVHIVAKRMNSDEMAAFIEKIRPDCVIDTTHPYAEEVTENICAACRKTDTDYIRLLRPGGETGKFIYAESFEHAAEILNRTSGNIFLTCGSKELAAFTKINGYRERVYARVLPMPEVLLKCAELGYKSSNIICMQGPFSKEINCAMLKETGARYLVTKDSGNVGGFREKTEAAAELGIYVIVIGRPQQVPGMSFEQVLAKLENDYNIDLSNDGTVENLYFPVFMPLKNKKVRIFGAGNVALRRIGTLIKFAAHIDVVAPAIKEEIRLMPGINIIERAYRKGDCEGFDLVVAATDDKGVNCRIAEECREHGILVSVADDRKLCTFLFPAIIKKNNIVIGVTSGGEDHGKVRALAENLRIKIDEILQKDEF